MRLSHAIPTFPIFGPMELEFRRSDPGEAVPVEFDRPDVDEPIAGIRCPICQWTPRKSSRWICWDCDYPEYFYAGCGTEWNTFETRGLCTTCRHQWIWTSCLFCGGWSRHEEWYAGPETSSDR